jgi:hypothetical protein
MASRGAMSQLVYRCGLSRHMVLQIGGGSLLFVLRGLVWGWEGWCLGNDDDERLGGGSGRGGL